MLPSIDLSEDITTKHPFVCTFSPVLRLGVLSVDGTLEKIKKIIYGLVEGIQSDGVADSLKNESIPGVATAMRQIDIKNDDNQIMFKTFIHWNVQLGCWHVLVEGATEMFWENMHKPRSVNKG